MWRVASIAGALLLTLAACTLAASPTPSAPTALDVVLTNNQDLSNSTATRRRRKKMKEKGPKTTLKEVAKRLAKLEKMAAETTSKPSYTSLPGSYLAGFAGGDSTPFTTFAACKLKCDTLGSVCAGCTCEPKAARLLEIAEPKAASLLETDNGLARVQ
eukprot:gnl/TRDRNA2_/TRDRNA2_176128_c2_seq5.p1 gnl/TRDRNA2_/TRDRNA2_176128_c2~~gnl/TRDRNA2_/TRDRNA2_176128_c2_seq5.p1  ORF type:complete len:158 (-),score=25.70 gnl/TRDRNA2_/TRDRNA2_176128_c2_seq5:266-739(-)